ncbi:hypothetical protein KFK14_13080 [Sphingobium phenoxybenzoativorans]|uniref:Uncharacterized protein n=1 Tax=Sphingobium phenoxybenzoativorans TaxID=1592790 RepID=A0A975K370_9SPHN|nr:hypothetical protein [Sphingobium phenoxybenzoativorans]QUT04080.1 hypothetical protein KFK14_13080 [Sphingobium phenoxybenzoativorans]
MTDIIPATRQARRAVVQAGGTPTHWIMTHEVESTLLTLMKPYMTHDSRNVPQRFLDGLPYYIQDDLPEPGFICGEGKLPDPHREQELREAIDMIMRKARDEMEPYRIELAEIEARKPPRPIVIPASVLQGDTQIGWPRLVPETDPDAPQ